MSIILATGGLGFIGSHICLEILDSGLDVLVVDSLINSSLDVINRIEKILSKKDKSKVGKLYFRKGDIRNYEFIESIFDEFLASKNPINSVIHLAGLKSISDSIIDPLNYWDVNVNGTLNLLSVMKKNNCNTIVFSSSATIYNSKIKAKIGENSELKPINPYGNTKFVIENLLSDLSKSDKNKWRIANLRYFNPVGAHSSGQLGEDPKKNVNNLFPSIFGVIQKQVQYLSIYGNDWPTKDGTCVRDFIHIMDLAEAHVLVLNYLIKNEPQNLKLNIGTGKGFTVLEVINTFINEINLDLKYKFVDRRKGDYPEVVADNSLAKAILNWEPKRNLLDMCNDSWMWIKNKKKQR